MTARPVLRLPFAAAALAILVAVAGCTPQPEGFVAQGSAVFDPNEENNRQIHTFNKALDTRVVRPASRGYSYVVPDGIQDSVANFADTAAMPRVFVNGLLQGDLRTAGTATTRFLLNATLGFAGLFDAATAFNVPEVDADFGETLYVWGFSEGAYREDPIFGPSTERHTVGRFVDLFLDPLDYVLSASQQATLTAVNVADVVGARGRFGDTIDSVLYESADSYAQSRSLYLQNRRFELAGDSADAYVDPYSDPSLLSDPYEDPYAE